MWENRICIKIYQVIVTVFKRSNDTEKSFRDHLIPLM